MKIAIIDTLISNFTTDRGAFGGLEKVAKDDAIHLHTRGHDVTFFYTGQNVKENPFGFKLYRVHDLTQEQIRIDGSMSPMKRNKEIAAKIIDWISRESPDVILYHQHAMTLAKKILTDTDVPLLHVTHAFLTDNVFMDAGRVNDYIFLEEHGALIVSNTEFTRSRILKQIDRLYEKSVCGKRESEAEGIVRVYKERLNFFNGGNFNNFMFVENPELEVLESDGNVIIASRAEKLKLTHRFNKIEVPTKVFWKHNIYAEEKWVDSNIAKFKTNKNIEFFWNHPYSNIMEHFRKSKICLITWPHETFGLTAFEAAQYGVPSIVYTTDKENGHASYEFLSKVYPVKMISYDNKEWMEETIEYVKSVDDSLETRCQLANEFREFYNFESYISEREKFLNKAISIRKKSTKDLFSF